MLMKNQGLPAPLAQYFQGIADIATEAVADKWPGPGPAPEVFDDLQTPKSASWAGIAVHPMAVLETAYIRLVQQAEAEAGSDTDKAREAAFQALSKFFILESTEPAPLGVATAPLIGEATKDLLAAFKFTQVQADGQQKGAYDLLVQIVQSAAELVARMTSAESLAFATDGVRSAAAYLGLYDFPPPDVGAHWARAHPNQSAAQTQALVDEVRERLIEPLTEPSVAAASPRSLYNIGPFYLYRLMHRFLGGAEGAPMTLSAKGIASGAATGALHRPDWLWLTEWHEDRVVWLDTKLGELNDALMAEFGIAQDVLRFHLKGGRAMYVALGAPEKGGNDWDTGVLINPTLSPEYWYAAFRKVNDLILEFLDQARFGYTQLLGAHAGQLAAPRIAPQATDDLAFDDLTDPDEHSEYTRMALLSGNLAPEALEMSGTGSGALAQSRVRPSGVNGELIDIGISTRSSVELLEHWRSVRVEKGHGVVLDGIPIPTLPYFVDDFSTIIREAIANKTVDRKLAKRLRRLRLVLLSDKTSITQAIAHRRAAVAKALPKAAATLDLAKQDLRSAALAWGLEALLASTKVSYTTDLWVAAFDDYIVAHAAALLDPQTIAEMWRVIGPEIPEGEERDQCELLFLIQNATSTLAHRILADRAALSKAVGAPDAPEAPLWQGICTALQAIFALNHVGAGTGEFYATSGLAAEIQRGHAGVDAPDPAVLSAGGAGEVFYRAGRVPVDQALRELAQRLQATLTGKPFDVTVTEAQAQLTVVVRTTERLPGIKIGPEDVVVLIVRDEGKGADAAHVLDSVDGFVTASVRDLARLFADRAADSEDYDLRIRRKTAYRFLLDDVLGRQIAQIRG
ncbi:hypothetical protein AIOL_002172 [Candidatus Rhodobacter oscarellae]|uniref:Uncharacterized protein n=1 Tax=Candidatus Rhodobacter oscarellae TaxID=1675527 RepID=A0A0J9E2Y1_9RHOB|nr:hypothetical protein [Candidatus Rhodobacter lobularis]KMW57211.1 hypothetical protein AIOL_002172 [Candidatus Rhodobacter lobularis]